MLNSSQRWDTATLVLELPSRAVIAHHAHDEHQLVYASTGVISVATSEGTWVAPANRAIWIPSGASHQHRAYGPTRFHGVGLPATRNPLGVDVPAVIEVSPLLRELIIHYTEQPDEAEEPRRRQRLLTVLIDQLAVSSQQPIRLPTPRDPRLVEVCKMVEENLSVALDLEDLAKACRTSSRTLARLFRDETRMSYVQWRTQLRLYYALRLLADGMQVGTVAHRCGWNSASTFVEVFRRTYGHTPGGRRQRSE
ncbi:helix-turn-helix transcriptional regulator [Rhodococcus sp. KBS0724]|uniref:AraC family transcriptional regulator n=1 Tax=Rhodococcus sp. KBS0724 TaxID=1179674 RepID=UPI00110E3CA0|nr:helix-turn-helix transcriptional regulator [Rhodococcus sp. KBS0724]TSD40218.1 helix-turn-helix transcriptional regulator [Rhodococcus sp. KBS0724]